MPSRVIIGLLCTLWLPLFIFAQSTEEQSIKRLLEQETKDFSTMTLADLVRKHWIMDEKTILNVTFVDGNHHCYDLAQLLALNTLTSGDVPKVEKYDFKFSIIGNAAFVTFSQKVVTSENDTIYSHECRFLEKMNEVWKIHASSVHQYMPKGDRE